MAVRLSKRWIYRGGALLALLVLGGFAARDEKGGWFDLFARQTPEPPVVKSSGGKSEEERSTRPKRSREEIQRLAEKWYQDLLEKHPEMKVTFKDVPDEKNGFLQFLNFMDRFGKWGADGLPIPENISAMLNGTASWDSTAMAKWIEENRSLVDEIKAIGLLEDQSVKGIDMRRTMFFGARLANDCSKLLLADARLAMESGDEESALQSANALFGLADHLDRMEMPSLLSETVSVLMRTTARKGIVSDILGAEGGTAADLAAWQALLAGDSESPVDLANVFMGEWHHTMRSYLMPGLLGDPDYLPVLVSNSKVLSESGGQVRDPDAVVEAHLRFYAGLVEQIRNAELAELPGISANPPDLSGLSPGGAAILETLFVGGSAWSKGWTRAQTGKALTLAALQAASGGELPLEPYTGKPFVIDRETGTVSVPEDPWLQGLNYQPLKIPVVK